MFIPIDDYCYALQNITGQDFKDLALSAFHYQSNHSRLYRRYLELMQIDATAIRRIEDIPFLPISFFKTHKVLCEAATPTLVFESSTTTSATPSRHYITDESLYQSVLQQGFEQVYGALSDWQILALLPSYLERGNSSLVYMVQHWMNKSKTGAHNFYLHNVESLYQKLKQSEDEQQKTLLIGVTYALLDFANSYSLPLRYAQVMETGGMKGRRTELTRQEVHGCLKEKFSLPSIHSEYGMTELLSQAYATSNGLFYPSSTMKVLVRDTEDPLSTTTLGSGAFNIIDLANIHSCCFIATEDVGKVYEDGSFEVLGRLDHSALRGCSLMAL